LRAQEIPPARHLPRALLPLFSRFVVISKATYMEPPASSEIAVYDLPVAVTVLHAAVEQLDEACKVG
jgi:hypothetical protein